MPRSRHSNYSAEFKAKEEALVLAIAKEKDPERKKVLHEKWKELVKERITPKPVPEKKPTKPLSAFAQAGRNKRAEARAKIIDEIATKHQFVPVPPGWGEGKNFKPERRRSTNAAAPVVRNVPERKKSADEVRAAEDLAKRERLQAEAEAAYIKQLSEQQPEEWEEEF